MSTREELHPIKRLIEERMGIKPAPATIWRWHNVGVKDRVSGKMIKLQVTRVGKGVFCTEAALDKFIQDQNQDDAT